MRALLVLSCLLMTVGCSTYSSQMLFPDPFVSGAGSSVVTFNNIASPCTIEIYTVGGEMLNSINETDGDGQATWEAKNISGENLTGGLYLYIIKSAEGEKKGKLIIGK